MDTNLASNAFANFLIQSSEVRAAVKQFTDSIGLQPNDVTVNQLQQAHDNQHFVNGKLKLLYEELEKQQEAIKVGTVCSTERVFSN